MLLFSGKKHWARNTRLRAIKGRLSTNGSQSFGDPPLNWVVLERESVLSILFKNFNVSILFKNFTVLHNSRESLWITEKLQLSRMEALEFKMPNTSQLENSIVYKDDIKWSFIVCVICNIMIVSVSYSHPMSLTLKPAQ